MSGGEERYEGGEQGLLFDPGRANRLMEEAGLAEGLPRVNAEGFYDDTWMLSVFECEHPECGSGAEIPAIYLEVDKQ